MTYASHINPPCLPCHRCRCVVLTACSAAPRPLRLVLGVLTTAVLVSAVVVTVVEMTTAVAAMREMATSRLPQLRLLKMAGTRLLMAHTVAMTTTTATTLHRRLHLIWLR